MTTLKHNNRFPWPTGGLKLSVEHKNRLYRTSIKYPTGYNIAINKNYKNEWSSLLKLEEKRFYLYEIINNKNKSKTRSDQFILNNKKITNPNEITNGLNYFCYIGPTLSSEIKYEGLSHRNFLQNDLHVSLFLEPTNEIEMINIINHLKEEAPGRDNIVARNLKCITDIAYPLARVANLSFQQGVFPGELKFAVITLLYKAKDSMMFNNYCPHTHTQIGSSIFNTRDTKTAVGSYSKDFIQ